MLTVIYPGFSTLKNNFARALCSNSKQFRTNIASVAPASEWFCLPARLRYQLRYVCTACVSKGWGEIAQGMCFGKVPCLPQKCMWTDFAGVLCSKSTHYGTNAASRIPVFRCTGEHTNHRLTNWAR